MLLERAVCDESDWLPEPDGLRYLSMYFFPGSAQLRSGAGDPVSRDVRENGQERERGVSRNREAIANKQQGKGPQRARTYLQSISSDV